MTKAEIAIRIHEQLGIPIEEAGTVLDQILELFKNILQSRESIMIAGFGKFTVRNKRARPGRNPQTGEAIEISARRVVSFQASHEFKREINSASTEGQEGMA